MFAEIFPRIIVKDYTKGEIKIKQDELFQAFNDDSDSWNVKLVEELFALAQKADKSFLFTARTLPLDDSIEYAANVLGYSYDGDKFYRT